jgi:hypothetical protein
MGVGSRIGGIVVRAQIGFDFNDPARQHAGLCPMGKHLAQQARSHQLRPSLKEGAREQAAGNSCFAIQIPVLLRAADSGSWFPTHSPEMQEAGSSTPLRFAQNDRMDGARNICEESRRNS